MASQGLISMARGDGFVQGAVSGFIGKISGPILQGIESDVTSSVIAGVFGGVASKATGGNFLQGALQAATVHLYNQRGGKAAQQTQLECKGMCHGVPGLGNKIPLNEEQTAALINGTLSGAGAIIAGVGCVGTGTTCGVTVVLSADAARQLSKATTGNDSLVTLATDLGATDQQAANIALGTDFVTATVSVNAAYKGLLMKSIQPFTAGAFGMTSLDIFSIVNTVQQLNKSVENQ